MLFKFFLFISLYLPFQIALNPATGIDLASIRVLILVLFFLWLAESLRKRKVLIKNTRLNFFVLAFLFFNFLSFFLAQNQNWSLRKLLFLFSIFPIYFVTSTLVNNPAKRKMVVSFLVASGSLTSLVGIFQFILQFFLGVDKLFNFWSVIISPFLGQSFSQTVLIYPSWLTNIAGQTYFRATAFFPDPHMFSFFLGLLLPLSLGLFLVDKKKIWIFSFFVIFLADILTFSRGGYLGLLAGILFILFFGMHKLKKGYRFTLISLIFLAVLVIFSPNPFSQRLFSSFNIKEGSNQGRLEMWRKAGETIKSSPLIGVGIGNFPLKVDPLTTYRTPIYAHNTYLDIATETGFLGLLSWLGIIFSALIYFWKKSKKELLSFCACLSLIIFSVHSIFETGLYSPVVLALFLIIVSLSNYAKKDTSLF